MRRHGWLLAIAAGLGATLLVMLGALQVRWLDRVAQTIAAQKRAGLFRRGSALATDLERELTRAHLWFQLEEAGPGRPLEELLRERWRSWRAAGRHPALLAAVWLVEPEAESDPRLRRLGSAGVLEAAPWPAALGQLRELLRGHVRLSGLVGATTADRAWLALPLGQAATVLLEVDGRYLTEELLPALARGSDGGDDGPVLVRLEDTDGRPLFAPPAGSFRSGEHDPIVVLAIRPELVSSALLAGMQPPPRWPPELHRWRQGPPVATMRAGVPPPPGLAAGIEPGLALSGPFGVFTHRSMGPPPPGVPPGPLPPLLHPPGLGAWRLSLALAAGPVDDLVTSLRRRNLALAFSILALLGGALAALTIAVRRAHALAERQRQFTASISHELRTPLAVIGSAAENLRDGTVDEAPRIREYGAMIHAESKRLQAMLDQALALAAGMDPRDELRRRTVDLRALVDSAVDSFTEEARARGALVERSHPPDAAMVTADPEALRQAVENVVGNALKYGGEPPRVRVRVSRAETAAGPRLQIAVEDHGMGIPADELGHVFEPFFRGREALARQIRGTGLGLALVSRVVEAHRGEVSVESAPGRGSVFVLRLPCAAPERER